MLSCWHDLLFLFCLLLFYLFFPSMGRLCGVGVYGLIECPHSLPALHSGLQNNNNNNNRITTKIYEKNIINYDYFVECNLYTCQSGNHDNSNGTSAVLPTLETVTDKINYIIFHFNISQISINRQVDTRERVNNKKYTINME